MQNGDIKKLPPVEPVLGGQRLLLQAMADQFGVKVTDYADVAFEAKLSPKFSYGCAVFLDSDRVNFQKEAVEGGAAGGPGAGAAQERLAVRRADPAHGGAGQEVRAAGRDAAQPGRAQGAGRLHQGARPGAEVYVHPHTGEAGAIGAAMETRPWSCAGPLDVHRHRRRDQPGVPGGQRRVDAATSAPTTARARSSTPRRRRSEPSPYISGFTCEGTVESEDAMIASPRSARS